MQKALNRDSPYWRLRHACPACTYKLKDEENLLFSLLFTMDGNDSLKRIVWRILDDDGEPRPSSETIDSRQTHDDFYLARDEVNKWADEAFEDLMSNNVCITTFTFYFVANLDSGRP